jgi:hypothetical protein
LWDGRPAHPKRTGGTPIPQTCGSYLILIPNARKKPLEKVAEDLRKLESTLANGILTDTEFNVKKLAL